MNDRFSWLLRKFKNSTFQRRVLLNVNADLLIDVHDFRVDRSKKEAFSTGKKRIHYSISIDYFIYIENVFFFFYKRCTAGMISLLKKKTALISKRKYIVHIYIYRRFIFKSLFIFIIILSREETLCSQCANTERMNTSETTTHLALSRSDLV